MAIPSTPLVDVADHRDDKALARIGGKAEMEISSRMRSSSSRDDLNSGNSDSAATSALQDERKQRDADPVIRGLVELGAKSLELRYVGFVELCDMGIITRLRARFPFEIYGFGRAACLELREIDFGPGGQIERDRTARWYRLRPTRTPATTPSTGAAI